MVKQVIVIRKDLNMRKGKMIAQGAHASLKVFLDRGYVHSGSKTLNTLLTDDMVEWCNGSFKKICVYVESEEELFKLHDKALKMKVPCAIIRDAGLTEFRSEQYTALAIGPVQEDVVDQITGELPLL